MQVTDARMKVLGGRERRGEEIHPYNDLVLVQWNLLIMDTLGTPDYCPL